MTARLIEEPRGGRRSTTLVRSLWPCKKALKRNSHVGLRGGGFISRWCERERVMRGRMFMSLPHEPKRSSISPSLPFLTDFFLSLWFQLSGFVSQTNNQLYFSRFFIFSFFTIIIIGILLNIVGFIFRIFINIFKFYRNNLFISPRFLFPSSSF